MKKALFSQIKLIGVTLIIFSLLSITDSCKKSTDTPGPNEVFIEGNAFNPGTITISVNTSITWTNKDAVAHTVTSDSGLFDSGTVNANGTYSHSFTAVGTFLYHCTVHPSMVASIVVK
jgi:plastocyanin